MTEGGSERCRTIMPRTADRYARDVLHSVGAVTTRGARRHWVRRHRHGPAVRRASRGRRDERDGHRLKRAERDAAHQDNYIAVFMPPIRADGPKQEVRPGVPE